MGKTKKLGVFPIIVAPLHEIIATTPTLWYIYGNGENIRNRYDSKLGVGLKKKSNK